VFLKNGLIQSEPINLSFTKLINKTSEEFVEWADNQLFDDIQCDKKYLYDEFIKQHTIYKTRLKQREFTFWLRAWGEYKGFQVTEGHSGDIRYIIYTNLSGTKTDNDDEKL
jgi:hypothetical protein